MFFFFRPRYRVSKTTSEENEIWIESESKSSIEVARGRKMLMRTIGCIDLFGRTNLNSFLSSRIIFTGMSREGRCVLVYK